MNVDPSIKHILVAHDLEPDSDAALDYALGLARVLGARITLFHTFEIPSMGAPEVLVMATDWTSQIGTAARESLDRVAARVAASGPPIVCEVRSGAAWREVEAFARENRVDLVIVGSHGRRGLSRALLGSVAERIVRTAPCPVLVVRAPPHAQ